MKINHKLLLMLTVLIGYALLASCTVSYRIAEKSSTVLIKPKIKLEIDESSSKLVVTSDTGSYCARGNSGCVAVGGWDTALITFELKKSDGWYFTEFKICRGDSKESENCDLENWETVEFFATDKKVSQLLFPDDSGIIDLKQLPSELTKFYVFNFNSVEQDFFYTIKACNSSSCVETDPEIKNKGRN